MEEEDEVMSGYAERMAKGVRVEHFSLVLSGRYMESWVSGWG